MQKVRQIHFQNGHINSFNLGYKNFVPSFFSAVGLSSDQVLNGSMQGLLAEREGSVQLTTSLRWLVL
jgi:hypothetical protein